jgi:uncharacterized protein with PIN domain
MTDAIRFHLDESVDAAIALGLRRRGVDVTTTEQVGLKSASDEKQLEFALTEQRVIFTHDDDFLAFAKGGIAHAGIAFCRFESRSIGEIISGLLLMRDCMAPDEMKNHVEFL